MGKSRGGEQVAIKCATMERFFRGFFRVDFMATRPIDEDAEDAAEDAIPSNLRWLGEWVFAMKDAIKGFRVFR